jgi:adenine-specific DNA-methyltransferase
LITKDECGVGTNEEGYKTIMDIFGKSVFDYSKPCSLIEYLINFLCDKSSIILDSFAGSGTTAHAVLNLNKADGGNRKFILVEMEDYAETITAERVKRVIDGYGDTEGTGGSFDFYELGEPVFDVDGNLNENIGTEKIREYIWYSEIRNEKLEIRNVDDCDSQISNSSFQIPNSKYFLGKYLGTAYYFYYEKDQITTLDKAFLNTITQRAEQYVIYADNCLLSAEFMQANHIIFKKIPRDVKKL